MKSKKFIICGVPRAWKSTLARKIAKQLWCSHIPLDPLMTSFHRMYPETWITLSMKCDMSEYLHICKTTTQFLHTYIKALDKELDSYVIEWFHMDIDMLVEYFGETHTIVVVWYPHVTSAQKLRAIRRYDTSDIHRTYVLDQTELVRQVEWFIQLSNMFYTKAEELGVDFVDTSYDYEKVIEEYLRELGWNLFDMWNHEKQILHSIDNEKFINEREVRYCKLWINIGYEQNWKNNFRRPVLILKKAGNVYLVCPLTSKGKDNNKFYYHLSEKIAYKESRCLLSQIRIVDKKRMLHMIWVIWRSDFSQIQKNLRRLYL